jgi:hypothetical protein
MQTGAGERSAARGRGGIGYGGRDTNEKELDWNGRRAIRCGDGGTRKNLKGGGIARRVRFQAVWWEGSRGREAGERDSVGLLVNHLSHAERVRAEPRHPAACCRDFGG